MGKRAYINDGNDNWIPLVSSLPNMDAYATVEYVNGSLNNINLDDAITTASAAAVAYLVDSAPSTLDTLNELAAALGDDANFATTVTTSLSNKLDASTAATLYEKLIPYSASAPSSPVTGDMWLDSSTNPPALKAYNGSTWIQLGSAADDDQPIIAGSMFS